MHFTSLTREKDECLARLFIHVAWLFHRLELSLKLILAFPSYMIRARDHDSLKISKEERVNEAASTFKATCAYYYA